MTMMWYRPVEPGGKARYYLSSDCGRYTICRAFDGTRWTYQVWKEPAKPAKREDMWRLLETFTDLEAAKQFAQRDSDAITDQGEPQPAGEA